MNARLFARLASVAFVALGALTAATPAHAEIGAAEAPPETESVCAELAKNTSLDYAQDVEWVNDDCEARGFSLATCAEGTVMDDGRCVDEPTECPVGYTPGGAAENFECVYTGV
jgi:hypothetical protein